MNNRQISNIMRKWGRKGGKAKTSKPKGFAALSTEQTRQIAQMGGRARAAKLNNTKKEK